MDGHSATLVTPESIISIPEFEGPWPDDSGSQLLYIERRFSPYTHVATVDLRLRHLRSNEVRLLRENSEIQTAFWIQGTSGIVLFERTKTGLTGVFVLLNALDAGQGDFVQVGTLPTGAQGLAAAATTSQLGVLAFSALADSDGKICLPHEASSSWSSGRVYDEMRVRRDFQGVTTQKLAVFCTTLKLFEQPSMDDDYFSPLFGLDAEYNPFGSMHMNRYGILLVAGADVPDIEKPHLTTPYYIPMPAIVARDCSARQRLQTPFLGSSSCPRICSNGDMITFCQKKKGCSEDDANILVVAKRTSQAWRYFTYEIYSSRNPDIQLSPQQVETVADGTVFFTADNIGRRRLFKTALPSGQSLVAEPITRDWSVDSFSVLTNRPPSMLLAGSSITLPRRWALLDLARAELDNISEGTEESDKLRLNEVTFESIEWPGADDVPVFAWLVRPRNFDPSKRYPLLYYIHGGPNVAVNNAWAAGFEGNWNLPLFAEQSFVVVAPNASGSTGFGQEYAERLIDAWGDKGYIDHARGFEYIKATLPYVDTDRAVALGMSYGGFMINWIQGHPLGRKFKALVAECAFINTATRYTFDLISSVEDHYGGPAHHRRMRHEKYNPIIHIEHWATPTLFISNEQDAVPMIESLAAIRVLQAKGIPTRLLSFPDEGHVVRKPDNRLLWWHTVFDWCREHTRSST